jgi:uncharacterized membrane protein (UPF0127 family)
LLLAPLMTACHQDKPAPGLQTTLLSIEQATLNVEIADTPESMERGLMFRDALPADNGMLFVFGQPRRANFWMHNTRIPLSIAYLDANGRILELHDMFPYDETPISSYGANVSYALEVNQGWFAKHGITPGMQINGITTKP